MAFPITIEGPVLIDLTVRHVRARKPRAYINSVTSGGVTIRGRIKKLELREGQFVTATVALKTKEGHDASYEAGSASWESSDAAVEVVQDANDELKATITGKDGTTNASALVTFKADGDPDAGETRDVVATLAVVCTKGEAVVAEITTDPPSDVP